MSSSFRDLRVWQEAMQLTAEVYKGTAGFPRHEIYGLSSQMRRAAVSVPSNIAEGRRRGTRKEFKQFLMISYGSGAELETQIDITKRLSFGKNLDFTKIDSLLLEVMKMLNVFTNNLRT